MHKYTSTRVPAHSGIPTLTPSQWTALPSCQILSPKPWTPGSPLSLALSITSSLRLLSEDLPGSPFTAISTATTSRRPGPSMPNSCINPSLLSPPFVHFSNPFQSSWNANPIKSLSGPEAFNIFQQISGKVQLPSFPSSTSTWSALSFWSSPSSSSSSPITSTDLFYARHWYLMFCIHYLFWSPQSFWEIITGICPSYRWGPRG